MALNKALMIRWVPIRANISDRLRTHNLEEMNIIDKLIVILDTIGFLDSELAIVQTKNQRWFKDSTRKKMFQHGVAYILNTTDTHILGIPNWLEPTAMKILVGKLFKMLG